MKHFKDRSIIAAKLADSLSGSRSLSLSQIFKKQFYLIKRSFFAVYFENESPVFCFCSIEKDRSG